MKKVFAIVLTLALCLSVLAIGAAAADTFTVHVDVSKVGWENANIYFWGAGSCDWPGKQMTTKDGDGWYTYEVPKGVTGVIINNGSEQTINMETNSGMLFDQECWVTVVNEKSGNQYKFAASASKPTGDVKPVVPTAPTLNYVSITGSMTNWDLTAESGKMEKISDTKYQKTMHLEAGEHQFKFTANGSWSDLNLGGAYAGSGVTVDGYWEGNNITFTLESAEDVVISLDLSNYDYANGKSGAKFTITVGNQKASTIKIHVVAPSGWQNTYLYTYNAESAGSWPGTKVNENVVVPATFGGVVISNGDGVQTGNIEDIDLTQEEVWIVVSAGNDSVSYTLSYKAPDSAETGDAITAIVAMLAISGLGIGVLYSKKKEF